MVAAVAMGSLAGPRMAVDLETYRFSNVPQGIAVINTFIVTNIGDQELIVTSVSVSCSCTRAELATNHLMPQQRASLLVIADTEGFMDSFKKTVTLTSNDPGADGDYRFSVYLDGNVIERLPYQTSVHKVYDNSIVLLDVREPVAFASGHLAGALSLPASQAVAVASRLPASALVMFYDQSGSSATEFVVTQALHAGGVAAVYNLRGGIDQWQQICGTAGIVAGPAAPWDFLDPSAVRAYSSTGAVQGYYYAEQLQSEYTQLIDIRSPAAFTAGHLVGAVNLAESAVAAFIDSLATRTPVVIYSQDGLDSDRLVYGLRTRGSRAQSLLGGLDEWTKEHGNYLVVASAS